MRGEPLRPADLPVVPGSWRCPRDKSQQACFALFRRVIHISYTEDSSTWTGGDVGAWSRGGGGDAPEPYFFLSYAHTPKNHPKDRDPNIWVERFYRDLCAHVLQLTSLPAGVPAGFMDQQMQPGEGWQERLSEALASCRVFVPLYSPRYFLSEQCGREWFVFSTRAVHHQARSNGSSGSGIVPALWVPVPAKQLPQ